MTGGRRDTARSEIDREPVLVGAGGKTPKQVGGRIEIGEIERLDRGVHVAVRDADVQRRDTATRGVEGVGVGAGAAAGGLELNIDVGRVGGLAGGRDDDRVVRAPAGDNRPTAEFDTGVPFPWRAGVVGCVGDIHRDSDVWREVEPDHLGALEADLLLDGADRTDGRLGTAVGRPAEPLGGRPGADAVVQPPGRDTAVLQVSDALFERDRITALDKLGGLVAVLGPDIDVLLGDIVVLLATLAQVDGGLADNAGDRPVVGEHPDVLSLGDRPVGAADTGQPEKAVVGDIPHHEADLVAVSRQRDCRVSTLDNGDSVAVGVGLDTVGERRDVLDPDTLTGCLEARGARGLEQIVQKLAVWLVHTCLSARRVLKIVVCIGESRPLKRNPPQQGGMSDGTAEVRVEGARKRDAGRGIARLPTHIQSRLGVLSGDPIIIEGERLTVAKVWPDDDEENIVRIDGDTRATVGATIGDYVTVRKASVADAVEVTLQPASDHASAAPAEESIRRKLVDRLVRAGKQLRIERYGPYVVTDTTPTGSVRITESTGIHIDPEQVSVREGSPGDTDPETTTDSGDGADDTEGMTTGTTYEDIGGLDEELELVREMIELPLSEPELFTRLGIEPPKGVLLYGPPGTGKTLIARAVANEVDAHFDTIHGPEIVSKYKGESEERLRAAFERASENAPAIIFLDEIDSIAGERDASADMENRVVAQLLTLLDGLESDEQVVVIGATNRVDDIDPAIRRGGRFDREIEIGVPSEQGRREILDVHTRDMPLAEDVDREELAGRLHGFVGADIASLAREAGMIALRRRERPEEGDIEAEDLEVRQADFETAMTGIEPSGMREYVAESPTTDFDDVGGLDGTKRRLREAIEWPLEYGPLFDAAATDPPSGVLLYGPPGTGKTLLAEAVAGESGVNFVRVAGPEVLDRYVGESEQAIRDLFERARQTAPAIVFLDEIDAIASQRGEGHEVTERVVSQLLTELDRAADHPKLVVLAATNRKDDIDPALLRPGRLEQHIEVPNPDETARREILDVHTRGAPLGEGIELDDIAADTAGYSGAELEAIVREASMRAIREVASETDPHKADRRADEVVIERPHFEAARDALDRQG